MQETRLSIVTTEKDIEALNADIESFILRKNSGSGRIEALNAESESIKAKILSLKLRLMSLPHMLRLFLNNQKKIQALLLNKHR